MEEPTDIQRIVEAMEKTQQSTKLLSLISMGIAFLSLLVSVVALFKTSSVGLLLRAN